MDLFNDVHLASVHEFARHFIQYGNLQYINCREKSKSIRQYEFLYCGMCYGISVRTKIRTEHIQHTCKNSSILSRKHSVSISPVISLRRNFNLFIVFSGNAFRFLQNSFN